MLEPLFCFLANFVSAQGQATTRCANPALSAKGELSIKFADFDCSRVMELKPILTQFAGMGNKPEGDEQLFIRECGKYADLGPASFTVDGGFGRDGRWTLFELWDVLNAAGSTQFIGYSGPLEIPPDVDPPTDPDAIFVNVDLDFGQALGNNPPAYTAWVNMINSGDQFKDDLQNAINAALPNLDPPANVVAYYGAQRTDENCGANECLPREVPPVLQDCSHCTEDLLPSCIEKVEKCCVPEDADCEILSDGTTVCSSCSCDHCNPLYNLQSCLDKCTCCEKEYRKSQAELTKIDVQYPNNPLQAAKLKECVVVIDCVETRLTSPPTECPTTHDASPQFPTTHCQGCVPDDLYPEWVHSRNPELLGKPGCWCVDTDCEPPEGPRTDESLIKDKFIPQEGSGPWSVDEADVCAPPKENFIPTFSPTPRPTTPPTTPKPTPPPTKHEDVIPWWVWFIIGLLIFFICCILPIIIWLCCCREKPEPCHPGPKPKPCKPCRPINGGGGGYDGGGYYSPVCPQPDPQPPCPQPQPPCPQPDPQPQPCGPCGPPVIELPSCPCPSGGNQNLLPGGGGGGFGGGFGGGGSGYNMSQIEMPPNPQYTVTTVTQPQGPSPGQTSLQNCNTCTVDVVDAQGRPTGERF